MGKQATKENLIEIGVGLIRHAGYTATGINQILETAKLPKGSFYHHFTTKDEFVLAVIQRYATGEQERWQRILSDTSQSPMTNLRRYFKELIAVYGRRGGPIAGCLLGNLSLEIAGQSAEMRELIKQSFDGWQSAIATIIEQGIAQGEVAKSAKADDLAAFLVNSWEGAQVRAKAEQNNKPLELFLETTFNILLRG